MLAMEPLNLLTALILALFSYFVIQTIYRLYFHPLSKFPGPKLAAIGRYYEFYFSVIKGGMYIWEVQRMHEEYGPIIRINHRELHIKDSHYYDEIYSSRKQDKDYHTVSAFGVFLSMISTIEHEHHRLRRGLLSNFFSKRAVVSLESLVLAKVHRVVERLEEAFAENAVMLLDKLFAALAADVISKYAYGRSLDCLESKDLQNDFRDFANASLRLAHVTTFFPTLISLFKSIPEWILEILQPQTVGIFAMRRLVHDQAVATLKLTSHPDYKAPEGPEKTIFHALCDPSVPAKEKEIKRLEEEGFVVLGAATETTARVLTVGSFYLYRDKSILYKLREELKGVMPQPDSHITWTKLEQLPYLTAFINESLRLSHALVLRLPRAARNESLAYKDFVIPPGTPVSQSSYFVHMDPTIFPDPDTFDPERWIRATERGERLTSLAYSELYLMFAAMARKFDMDLHGTTMEDIRVAREYVDK
ncbi:benzoate 4-monooxygenase cytochrome P450 [Arthroderma uncinatum]|uniref:benzoate 4-monooxygenase cytochrome P450 n=1 Tax=Arthroderma uncinatum TaxID=74035 RepID=UPI00144A5ADE|nr:benzoate 4-monooxygenase cytochrome P450 [Arthroderma uncinatum]KAF3482546.1 benzoate 4-monooxygenase cytochrome P450 [Arthroderma uncinatum]